MNLNSEDTFSVNEDLLTELEPVEISSQPLVQHEMLCKINIAQKRYEGMLREYEEQRRKSQVAKRLDRIKNEAREALKKSKSLKNVSPKNKWGHSVFAERAEIVEEAKPKQEKAQEIDKKIVLKPINQRIKQYKQQQAAKNQQIGPSCCLKQTDDKKIEQQRSLINRNAQKILEEISRQKRQKQQQKMIIQAKIRALQIKASKKVQISKKKPLEQGEFDLAISQYSTFSARANNRTQPKNSKAGLHVEKELAATQKTQSAKAHKSRQANKRKQRQQLAKTGLVSNKEEQEQVEPTQKGPFYIWNIPITAEDEQKLNQNYKEVFFNVDRFNYKTAKTFREEANEYLADKMMQKMKQTIVQTRQQAFLSQVQKKKDSLNRQFSQQQDIAYVGDAIGNEDQLFRPTAVPNFLFYTKNAPY